MNEEKFINIIKLYLKQPIEECKILAEGYWNIVFEINKEWIFRFSKEERDVRQLEIEKRFLQEIEESSPIPVPHFKYKGNGFIGCKKFNWVPFTTEVCNSLSEKQRNDIWKSLGKFLNHLHSTDFKHTDLVEYTFGDNDFWNDLWRPVEPQLSKKTREKAFEYFTKCLEEESKNPIIKTICHWDLHPSHILFDELSKRISWIIDFGRICINDPAVDFNLIERFFGKDAIDIILQNYKRNIPSNFRERIAFQNRRRLFAAFFHANIIGDTSPFPRYIKRIEEEFSN